jgi:hypothetical protein
MMRPTATLLPVLLLWLPLLSALAPAIASAGGRKFFLSQNTAFPDAAPDACGRGYHMASLWELFDPTLLKYDAKRGATLSDAGSGPPAGLSGWIRTGGNPHPDPTPGIGNCMAWTSTSNLDFGTVVSLNAGSWGLAGRTTSPWEVLVVDCDTMQQVWCRQN